MKEAFDIGFPLRGAISYGEFIVDDNVFVGKAYNEAVRFEKIQKWSGCIVTPICLKVKEQYKLTLNPIEMYTIEYDCPIEKSKVKMHALNMRVHWHEKRKKYVEDYFPEVVSNLDAIQKSDVIYKIEETREFYEYVKSNVHLSQFL